MFSTIQFAIIPLDNPATPPKLYSYKLVDVDVLDNTKIRLALTVDEKIFPSFCPAIPPKLTWL